MTDAAVTTLPPALVSTLRSQVSGRVTTPSDIGWENVRRGWDLYVDQQPVAVLEVESTDDIVAAVRFGARHGVPVTAQPVGHGATNAVDGCILLRTTGLRRMCIDADGRTARVEPGVRWRELNAALSGTGLTSLPGSSGDPTVVGYTLGGGTSWFGRKYGLAANRIRAVELVDPAGEHVRVARGTDPDLFWAVRGGGGEFGIVTAMEAS